MKTRSFRVEEVVDASSATAGLLANRDECAVASYLLAKVTRDLDSVEMVGLVRAVRVESVYRGGFWAEGHTISPVNFFTAARELSPSPSRTSSAQGGWGICIIGERTSLAPRERPIRSFLSGQARRCFNVRAGLTQYLLQATKHPSFAAGGPGWTCCSLPNTS